MIDSHCHIYFESLKNNLPSIIDNAQKNYITGFLTINTDPEDFLDHYKLIKNYQSIYISYGLHPQTVSKSKSISRNKILNYTNIDKVIGIGETGLDFYHSTVFQNKQIEIFESHIEASKILNLTIIIHQRNSENEIINILKKYKNDNLKIVFHCFTGSKFFLEFCLENNYYISLSGIVTFKNANSLRDILINASLEYLLIETDSPYLSPVPMRGKDNEPSYVKFTAEYLANFYSINKDEFVKLTDNNFYKLFSRVKKDI